MIRRSFALMAFLWLLPAGALAAGPLLQFTVDQMRFDGNFLFVDGNSVATSPPGLLDGAELIMSLDWNDIEFAGATAFTAAFDGNGPIEIKDGATTLLSFDVVSPIQSGDPQGVGMSLGSVDPLNDRGRVLLTGGTLSDLFSADGYIKIELSNPNPSGAFTPFQLVYDNPWVAGANVSIQFTPEPGTALLLGGALSGLAWSARRRRAVR